MTPSPRFMLFRYIAMACLAMLTVGAWAWAQPAAPTPTLAPTVAPEPPPTHRELIKQNPPGLSPTGELPTFQDLFKTNPTINTIILVLSVIATAMFLYFLIAINTRTLMPATFVDDVTKFAIDRQYEQASTYCRNHRHIFAASVLQRAFQNADKDHSVLMQIVESEGQRRAGLVWNRITYLIDVSTIAPMLGLLGTVLGMLQAFLVMPTQSASVGSKVLAQSIGGAMSATFFGLSVAILAVIYYAIIRARTIKTLSEVEQVVQSVTDHIRPVPAGYTPRAGVVGGAR